MGSRYNITDFDIQALVDNELHWEHEKMVLSFLETDSAAQKRYQELCKQKNLLKRWWESQSGVV